MYLLEDHLRMMCDGVRAEAYARAIASVVKPGDVVLDLGAGAGFLGFLAVEAGASRVYAVEADDAIHVARVVALRNGKADRLVFLHEDARFAELPEPADVIVTDLRGALPFLGDNLAVLSHVRRRFWKPHGRIVPLQDTVYVAPVEAEKEYEAVGGWRRVFAGVDYSAASETAVGQWRRVELSEDSLLSLPREVGRVDYRRNPEPLRFRGEFRAFRNSTCHGIGAWFEAELAPGVKVSTAPGAVRTVYGQAFFPLLRPLSLHAGDTVELVFAVHPTGHECVFRWGVRAGEREEMRTSLDGVPWNPSRLRKRSSDYVPRLGSVGRVELYALSCMTEGVPLGEIATRLVDRFPSRFADPDSALGYLGVLAERYCDEN